MKITAGTIARTLWLFIALLNQVLIIAGKEVLPFAEEEVYEVVSFMFTASASIVAWWRNNSFTRRAIMADEILRGGK